VYPQDTQKIQKSIFPANLQAPKFWSRGHFSDPNQLRNTRMIADFGTDFSQNPDTGGSEEAPRRLTSCKQRRDRCEESESGRESVAYYYTILDLSESINHYSRKQFSANYGGCSYPQSSRTIHCRASCRRQNVYSLVLLTSLQIFISACRLLVHHWSSQLGLPM
jgi:hypothetical protein